MKPEQNPKIRAGKITGSNCSGMLGENRFSSEIEEYSALMWDITEFEEVRLGKPKPNISEKQAVKAGTYAEPILIKRFQDETGIKLRAVNRTYVSKEWPICQGHIDAKVEKKDIGIECKTASSFRAAEFSESYSQNPKIPQEYRCQINHYFYITGWELFYLVVLIGGNDFRIFKIERNEKEIQEQVKNLRKFWEDHIVTRIPPQAASTDEAKLKFPISDEEEIIDASPLFLSLYMEEQEASKEDKLRKKRSDERKTLMMEEMKTASHVIHENKTIVTWKTSKRVDLDKKRLKKEMPELFELDKFGKETSYRTLKLHYGDKNGD